LRARHICRWVAVMALPLAVSLFFAVSLGRLDSFLYRPDATVSDLTVTFWPNIHYIQDTWRTYRQIAQHPLYTGYLAYVQTDTVVAHTDFLRLSF